MIWISHWLEYPFNKKTPSVPELWKTGICYQNNCWKKIDYTSTGQECCIIRTVNDMSTKLHLKRGTKIDCDNNKVWHKVRLGRQVLYMMMTEWEWKQAHAAHACTHARTHARMHARTHTYTLPSVFYFRSIWTCNPLSCYRMAYISIVYDLTCTKYLWQNYNLYDRSEWLVLNVFSRSW